MTRLSLPEPLKGLEYTRRKTGLWVPSVLRGMGLSRREYGARKCCCDEICPCDNCADGPPCCYKIVISGMADDSCGHCTCLDGTYYVGHTSACKYYCLLSREATASYFCDVNDLWLWLEKDGADYKLHVDFSTGFNTLVKYRWTKNFGATKPDCADWSDFNIPLDVNSGLCDASSATCVITKISKQDEEHCPCPPQELFVCRCCLCYYLPDNFTVVLAGITNDVCGGCAALNGTYILEWDTAFGLGLICRWSYTLGSTICGVSKLELALRCDSLHSLYVYWYNGGAWGIDPFSVPTGGGVDCKAVINNLNLPYHSRVGTQCNFSTGTCIATAND